MTARIYQFPTSPLYDVRLEFARRVEQRMHEIEEAERVYAGERPSDTEPKEEPR